MKAQRNLTSIRVLGIVAMIILSSTLTGCSFFGSLLKGRVNEDPNITDCRAKGYTKGMCQEMVAKCSLDSFRNGLVAAANDSDGDGGWIEDLNSLLEKSEGGLNKEECLSLTPRQIFYEDAMILATAESTNSSEALIQAMLGRIYTIRLKDQNRDHICLTAKNGEVKWSACDQTGIDQNQQFHFISRQTLSYQMKQDSINVVEEAFKLIPVKNVQQWYTLSKDNLDFKGFDCVSLRSNDLGFQNCETASYFTFAPSEFGFNKALSDPYTNGEISGQDKNRYMSLVAFRGNDVNDKIGSDLFERWKLDFKFSSYTATFDPYFEFEINACTDMEKAIKEQQDNRSCNVNHSTKYCKFLAGQLGNLNIGVPQGEELHCDTCVAIEERILNPFNQYRDDDIKLFKKHCNQKLPGDDRTIKLTLADSNNSLYHVNFNGNGNKASLTPISNFLAITDSQNDSNKLSVEECEFDPNLTYGQCNKTESLKRLADYEASFYGEQVYQLRTGENSDKCLRINDSNSIESTNCEDKDNKGKSIDQSTHFTRELVQYSGVDDETRSFLQFRSKKDPILCVNNNGSEFYTDTCLEENKDGSIQADGPSQIFEISDSGMFPGVNREIKVHLFPCQLVSDDETNRAYDCNYEVPKWIKILEKLSMALIALIVLAFPFAAKYSTLVVGFGVLLLTVPTYVVDGILCNQNESKSAQVAGCMGLGMGLGIDLLSFGLIDAGTLGSKILYKTGKMVNKKPVLNAVGKMWQVSEWVKMLENSASAVAKGTGDIAPDVALRMKYIRHISDKILDRNQLNRILKTTAKKGELCGRLDCTHPALKSSEWATQAGRDRFIQEIIDQCNDYLTKLETLPPERLSRQRELWNRLLYNGADSTELSKEIIQSVKTLLESTDDAAKQSAYISLRNLNVNRLREVY